MSNLYNKNVDTSNVDNLVSGTLIPSKVLPVKVGGTGVVKRGTTLTSSDGETFTKSATAIQAVLLTDVDASSETENVGAAAFGGEFNQNVIDKVMGAALTDTASHQARINGRIFIEPMNAAPEAF